MILHAKIIFLHEIKNIFFNGTGYLNEILPIYLVPVKWDKLLRITSL